LARWRWVSSSSGWREGHETFGGVTADKTPVHVPLKRRDGVCIAGSFD